MAQNSLISITVSRGILTDVYVSQPKPDSAYQGINIYGVIRTSDSSLRVTFKNFEAQAIQDMASSMTPCNWQLGCLIRQLPSKDGRGGGQVIEVHQMSVKPVSS
jgi:hypothetical protein